MYSGKYKLQGQLFWRKLKRVKGDWIENGVKGIVFEDDSQFQFPASQVTIYWDKSRFEDIRNKVEAEAGQAVPVKR